MRTGPPVSRVEWLPRHAEFGAAVLGPGGLAAAGHGGGLLAVADGEQALAGHFGIRSIPTLMIFREQVIVFQQAGALPKGALDDLLAQVRGLDMAEVMRGAQPHEPEAGGGALQ